MDESESHGNEALGVNSQSPLSRALQGAANGHGLVVFQPERFGREL